MKIAAPELARDIPVVALQEPSEAELSFKEIMADQPPSPKGKKPPLPLLAMLADAPDELDFFELEENPSDEDTGSDQEEKDEPQNCQLPPPVPVAIPIPPQDKVVSISPVSYPAQTTQEVMALMEKVGSEMIVMNSEGSTKTTLVLDSDAFASSLLNDAVVTIEEFSSAPKIFNVKITASPEAIGLVRVHVEEFLKLFQERKFGFSINRIDTELASSRPLFSRKEKMDGEEGGDQQSRDNQ